MNPAKVIREKVDCFTDLPNIGPETAKDFELLGFSHPAQLVKADPLALYESLCLATGTRLDPCVLDVFLSVTHFLSGDAPKPWWFYTEHRKRQYLLRSPPPAPRRRLAAETQSAHAPRALLKSCE